eukprot:6465609-Amphidinium_carterae.3
MLFFCRTGCSFDDHRPRPPGPPHRMSKEQSTLVRRSNEFVRTCKKLFELYIYFSNTVNCNRVKLARCCLIVTPANLLCDAPTSLFDPTSCTKCSVPATTPARTLCKWSAIGSYVVKEFVAQPLTAHFVCNPKG